MSDSMTYAAAVTVEDISAAIDATTPFLGRLG